MSFPENQRILDKATFEVLIGTGVKWVSTSPEEHLSIFGFGML